MNLNTNIQKYHLLCGIGAPTHLSNIIATSELNEIMSLKEQKIFLKHHVNEPDKLSINENIIGAHEKPHHIRRAEVF